MKGSSLNTQQNTIALDFAGNYKILGEIRFYFDEITHDFHRKWMYNIKFHVGLYVEYVTQDSST